MTREQIIKELRNMQHYNYTLAPNEVFEMAIEALKSEPKHGRWNTVVHSNNHITYYCPICGSIFNKGCADLGEYNYCPNCGASMMDEVGE